MTCASRVVGNPLEAQVSAMSYSSPAVLDACQFAVEFDRRHKANRVEATAVHRRHPAPSLVVT